MPATASNFPKSTPQKAQGYYSFTISINDDDFYLWDFVGTSGFVFVSTNSSVNHGSLNWLRSSAAIKISGASSYDALSVALNGTTGADGKITVSASGSKVYIENRSGGILKFTVTMLCDNGSVEL
jgi:hypothetical protein